MLVKVGVYCLRGSGHWDTYDQDDGGVCGTKGPDVLVDVDLDDLSMYPAWLQKVIATSEPRKDWNSELHEQYLLALDERDAAVAQAERLEASLRACASAAGHPDAAEGCRQVLRIWRESMSRKGDA